MPPNTIRDLFVARIKQLLSQFEGSKSIEHGPTVGAMREEYLKSILREMLPPKFAPESGFIADLHGHISPQLDMIFFDRSELPAVSLVGDTVIVPVEVSLLTAEIKSRVTTGTLKQVAKQRRDIEELKPAYIGTSGRRPQLVPTIVFGFDSKVSSKRLKAWINETSGVEGICIVNKLAIFPTVATNLVGESRARFGQAILEASNTEGSELLLGFIGGIYRLLYFLALINSTVADQQILDTTMMSKSMWPWEGYLSEFHINHLPRPK